MQIMIPDGATTSTVEHRVAFYETDAMEIVHHSNYLRFFENARVIWLEEHDKSYPDWIAMDLHFVVTHAELDYRQPARFDDVIEIKTWLEWVRGASLAMAYTIVCDSRLLVTGRTKHATINGDGRVRRIPKPDRERLGRSALPINERT
ncbi:MAG: thioesterase family protein [Myxococcales bacterium]|nr:acyl-CoA thioesterase [Myxococcales bacterium]HIK83810.1 acyl-CoA thioesterase [Myxococcales bacterium]